jgi:hypothetical protein
LRIFWDLAQEFGRRPKVSLWLPLSAAVVMAAAPVVTFPDKVFPVQAVEGNLLRLAPPGAMPRILTSDQWGDYLIYRLYPRQRVFFDGRSDFFGPAIGADYQKLLAGESPWRELLDRYHFELALLPHDWALSTALELMPGWRKVYEDGVAVLYARDVTNPAQPEPSGNTTSPQRRGDAEISAEPLLRRRRGGMAWETLAGVSPAVARRVGQAIALCGLSCFAASLQADRRQKAIVCPTGLDEESMNCGWVSGEKTKREVARRSAIQPSVGRAILPAAVARDERRLKAGGSQDWLPHEVLP